MVSLCWNAEQFIPLFCSAKKPVYCHSRNGRLLKTNPEYDLCNVKAGCTWTEAGMLEGVAIVGRILSYMTTVRPIKYNIEQQIHMSHH